MLTNNSSEARPNYEAENEALKKEMHRFVEMCRAAEDKNGELQKRILELEKERQFLLGQVEAFQFALKGGAAK